MNVSEIIDYVIFMKRDCNLDTGLIIESLAMMGLSSDAIANAIKGAIKELK